MIERCGREELARCLRMLVSGAMTNDDFDDRHYEHWLDSGDAAVSEVSQFGWSLYSSDLLWPYKLEGRYAVSEEILETANRALLFLATDLDYEWPRNVKGAVPYWVPWGQGCYLVVGLILLFSAIGQAWPLTLLLGLLGALLASMTVHWLVTNRRRTEEMERFFASGDFSVWPFLCREDFLIATVTVKPYKPPSSMDDF
ncbi:hypothetical protein [Singulisphaera sp. PoT]|uniref:hypothetical protein n=1 Tax=Singulisphaera sp. PoT TaxID=3411797 RepID=UPI003BF50E27